MFASSLVKTFFSSNSSEAFIGSDGLGAVLLGLSGIFVSVLFWTGVSTGISIGGWTTPGSSGAALGVAFWVSDCCLTDSDVTAFVTVTGSLDLGDSWILGTFSIGLLPSVIHVIRIF